LILGSAEAAGLVKTINGKRFVDLSGAPSPDGPAVSGTDEATGSKMSESPVPPPRAPQVTVGSGVNINIEIHIAADASAQTVEDIFKNMRRYVLRPDGDAENAD